MKLTTGILIMGMVTGAAWAQNPDIIENTRNTMKAIERKQAINSNAALAASQGQPSQASAPATQAVTSAAASKPAAATPSAAPKKAAARAAQKNSPAVHVAAAPKPGAAKKTAAKKAAQPKEEVAIADSKTPADNKKEEPKPINLTGRRDPFVSPVVNRSMVGSGCNTGKKCLSPEQVALKGIISAQSGMIAVVVNALNKAYFLRENDPVFNGYVVKITGDSIVFKETIQDKLGKNFTREVTKKITTPAV
jgi:hypothetical protein